MPISNYPTPKPTERTVARFLASVRKGEGNACWEWIAERSKFGYGKFFNGERREVAHRWAWKFLVGPIPDGMQACHRCDNPSCVRPEHLFLGTQSDNVQDMMAKGRRRGPSGEAHPRARLSVDDVRAIRAAHGKKRGGLSKYELAKKYGVSPGAIAHAVRGRSWKEVA